MKRFALSLMLLVVTTGLIVGCAKDPGTGAAPTQEELDNDTAIGEEVPGGV